MGRDQRGQGEEEEVDDDVEKKRKRPRARARARFTIVIDEARGGLAARRPVCACLRFNGGGVSGRRTRG